MIWEFLNIVFVAFFGLWLFGVLVLLLSRSNKYLRKLPVFLPAIANVLLMIFIVFLWSELERPPLKTMAETRLWYAMFVSMITWIVFIRTKSKPL